MVYLYHKSWVTYNMCADKFNHPKYGIILNPSWKSMEICFSGYNNPADPDEYNNPDDAPKICIIDALKKVPRAELIKFLGEFIILDNMKRVEDAWQDCFGTHFGVFNGTAAMYTQLSNDELIYFIIQCDNHAVLHDPGFFAIVPEALMNRGVFVGIGKQIVRGKK